MLQNCFFFVESHNKDLPPEEWTLVYENNTAGAYNTTLDWGKYKIELSGGGGGGGASSSDANYGTATKGQNGQLKTHILPVLKQEIKTISGILATGGAGGYADGPGYVVIPGTGGTGAHNGATGTYGYAGKHAAAGGGGGGSSTLEVDSAPIFESAGGNGGNAVGKNTGWAYGGTGGNGGGTSSGGASGGNAFFSIQGIAIAGAGANGFIRIYKSNLYPEPL